MPLTIKGGVCTAGSECGYQRQSRTVRGVSKPVRPNQYKQTKGNEQCVLEESPVLLDATLFFNTKMILLAYFHLKKEAKKKLVMTNKQASRQLKFWHQTHITGFN